MIKSMTGFGAAAGEIMGQRARLEIKTLNNRYREFVVRMPHFLGSMEESLKKLINAGVSRGRVELWLQVDLQAGQDGMDLAPNLPAARKLRDALENVRSDLGLPGPITMGHLLRLERVFLSPDGPNPLEDKDPDKLWEDLKALAEKAVAQLISMRVSEGALLQADIERRLDDLEITHKELKAIAQNQPMAITKRYQARLEELAETVLDPARLAQEAAILAEKLDITEEITRFASHVKNFRQILCQEGPVGRRLEFLLQELLREANTMGSKSQSLPITELVLSFKSELEKIREQVLNVE
ncbi:MAG: YicC family protein [Deltaproteobacteria bacterium]|jgi:uncharacterized protein (TIGR00255 family)|nr:YicC family protein [Deltaproteobacteria bacterium]